MSDQNPENVALFSRPQGTYGESYPQPQHGQYKPQQSYQDGAEHKPVQVVLSHILIEIFFKNSSSN